MSHWRRSGPLAGPSWHRRPDGRLGPVQEKEVGPQLGHRQRRSVEEQRHLSPRRSARPDWKLASLEPSPNQQLYASRYRLALVEPLGSGMHGNVYLAEDKVKPGNPVGSPLKSTGSWRPTSANATFNLRLRENGVLDILDFEVPQLVRSDDELLAIEMTIVSRPFVLDFAGAYLDEVPSFSEEIWAEWEADKLEKFEDRWPIVQAVLAALDGLGFTCWMSPRTHRLRWLMWHPLGGKIVVVLASCLDFPPLVIG